MATGTGPHVLTSELPVVQERTTIHTLNSGLPRESEIISALRRNYLARFSKTSFATDRAENALGQPA